MKFFLSASWRLDRFYRKVESLSEGVIDEMES